VGDPNIQSYVLAGGSDRMEQMSLQVVFVKPSTEHCIPALCILNFSTNVMSRPLPSVSVTSNIYLRH